MQRILFHPAPTVEWLKGLKVETLGKSPKGTWLAADDSSALDLLKRDKSTLALYPTRDAYKKAMEGLTEPEAAEAIALRVVLVESNPRTESIPDFYWAEREGLEAIAVASASGGANGPAWVSAFQDQIEVLLSINGTDAYKGYDGISLFSGNFDYLNRLNWEEEALRRHPGVSLPPLDSGLDRSRKDLALQLELGEKKLGANRDHVPTGKVFERLERGIFAKPLDEMLVKGIAEGHEPVVKWKDGFVSIWPEFALGQIPMADKEKTILYFNGQAFQAEFMTLTKSQVKARLGEQSKVSRQSDAAEYLAQLVLTVLLQLKGTSQAAAKFDKPLSDLMSRHATIESESLRVFLFSLKPWSKPTASAPGGLHEKLDASLKEIEYWNRWAALKGWPENQADIERLLVAKKKMLSRLPKVN